MKTKRFLNLNKLYFLKYFQNPYIKILLLLPRGLDFILKNTLVWIEIFWKIQAESIFILKNFSNRTSAFLVAALEIEPVTF